MSKNMEDKYIVGIDFGHGETAACLIPLKNEKDENGNLIVTEPSKLQINRSNKESEMSIKSIIYQNIDNGDYSIARKGNCTLIQGFKMEPSKLKEKENIDKKEAFEEFVKQVIKHVVENNSNKGLKLEEDGECNFKLCIACPTSWNDLEIHEYENFFNAALEGLGIRVSWVIRESDAAYFSNREKGNNGCVLLIDYGSSTIDYTAFCNDEKISKDEWSEKDGGASQIEEDLLLVIKQQHKEKQDKILPNYIAQQIKLRCRELKEGGMFAEDEPRETYFSFDGEEYGYESYTIKRRFFDDTVEKSPEYEKYRSYRDEFEKRIRDIKTDVESEAREKITKVVLSGGACAMKWVENSVNEIFEGSGAIVERDTLPQYVVAEGIVKYAKAQYECIDEIKSSIEALGFDRIYQDIWKEEVYNLLSEPINTTCNNYKIAENNNSLKSFMENIEQSIKTEIEDANNANSFILTVQKRISNDIKKIVEDIIKKKFSTDNREVKVSTPMIDSIDILPLNSNLYERIKKSFRWKFLGFIPFGNPNMEKTREYEDRKKMAKRASETWEKEKKNLNIYSGFDEELRKISGQMKEVAMKCAIDTFYKNELFKTTFTDASHS